MKTGQTPGGFAVIIPKNCNAIDNATMPLRREIYILDNKDWVIIEYSWSTINANPPSHITVGLTN